MFKTWALFLIMEVDMEYTTIKTQSKASFFERKSEFIGYIAPVKSNEEAVDFINSIKAMHRKARHNVFAYILREDNITRYSDDGEPQGTAGVPVLEVLQKEGLTDICCVVTRYFGGILLGGGGLLRAYTHACKIAVASSTKMQMCQAFELSVTLNYNLYGKITTILPDFNVKIIDTQFSDDVTMKILVKINLVEKLTEVLTDATNGKILIVKSNEQFEDFS